MTTELTDEELISAYIADMEFRELSPVTIRMSRYNLRKYAKEVGLRADSVIELRHKLQQWLMRPSLQPQTRGLWLTAIHGAYKWWNAEGYFRRVEAPNGALVDFDPTVGLVRPKTKKGTPHPIPEDELSEALRHADARMKCWLLLGAMCGTRCKEIAGIRREDVQDDLEPMNLHLEFTKGSKPRDVPLPPEVLACFRAFGMPDTGRLWPDVEAEDVSRQINAHLHGLGIKSTAHKLRHRYATAVYAALEGDSFLLAELLGHSDPSISRIYAAPNRAKASAVLDQLRVKSEPEEPTPQ